MPTQLAIEVKVALASGRTATDKAELVAGRALIKMLYLGVSVVEVVERCAGDLTPKETGRLRRIGALMSGSAHPKSIRGRQGAAIATRTPGWLAARVWEDPHRRTLKQGSPRAA